MKTPEKLFQPIKIGNMELNNRIVMAPLGIGFTFATEDGSVTDRFIAFYEARAKGGVGLIQLTVAALGRPHATGLVFAPGMLSIIDDEHIPSARKFVDAIHRHGTKVSFQITHHGSATARAVQQRPPVEYPELMRVVTATGTTDPVTGFQTHSMTREEILDVTEAFGQAAKRGKAAGFDAVRIQGCHAYLIRQFLSPRTNKRTDEYGGSIVNRARFACEIVKRVRKEVGEGYPIIFRMNGDEHLEGGITMEEAVEHAKLFVEAGVDILDVSSGPPETSHWQYPIMFQESGCLVPSAASIKKAVNVPVMAVGKINVVHGERILQEGSADLIQMGRPLMADPDLANKAKEGRLADIRPCIFCGHCQAGGPGGGYANCSVNMAMGKELEYRIEPAEKKKTVMVIGGGPAGMEAARTLAERGHETSLYEKSAKLGGQWKIVANHLPEEQGLIDYLSTGVKKAGVNVFLNQAVTRETIDEKKPDAVVVATGSVPTSLDIPGIDGKNVVQATDVLIGEVETGQNVVVIGGRIVGLSAALYLADQGKNVSVITRSDIARGLNSNMKKTLIEFLVRDGVYLYSRATPDSITGNGVNIWWTTSEAPVRDNMFLFLKADTVVLAVGAENDNKLVSELEGIVPEIYPVGDCTGKRSVFAAIRGGSEIGRTI
ncbi:MAG TPA: FAD-dependent oxidoreductase [Dehalococcoidia bacterium]|nr:FAD-dependent oxidoreductase [Dehalococcoidia bacterium]